MSLLIGNKTDPNKILPIQYPWAREYYKIGVANNWTPEEIPMQDDIEQWKSNTLTEHERRLILWNLGFFSTAESLTANNVVLAVYKHINDPACRLYLSRQLFEEAVHTEMFIYCCDSLGLDPENIYTMYNNVPSIKEKDDFVINLTKMVFDKNFEIRNINDIQDFLMDLFGFYGLMEGIFFYGGFAMMLALKRQKKMIGIGEQFEYVLKDECCSPDTELLTTNGWTKITDINKDTSVAQWNSNKNELSFCKPIKLSKAKVNKLFYFKNDQIDQLVSENHRVTYCKDNLEVTLAKDVILDKNCKFISAAPLTDGKKKLAIEEIFLLKFYLNSKIPDICINDAFNKLFELDNVSVSWCKDVIEEVLIWNEKYYSSCLEKNVDFVQAVATLAGYKTNKTPTQLFIYKNEIKEQPVEKTEIDYNGYVYGVEVPTGFIVIRRNGKVSITGNSVHLAFGCDLMLTIKKEYPDAWNKELEDKMVGLVEKAVELERKYAFDACPTPLLGINAETFCKYVEYIADRRLERLGLKKLYKTENPFPWMSQSTDLPKEKNFFESRPTEYQTGNLKW